MIVFSSASLTAGLICIIIKYLFLSSTATFPHIKQLVYMASLLLLLPPQALEAQEQEKDRLCLPQQNPSPVPGNPRSGSPRSDRTPTPEPQSSLSPAASSPDLTATSSTPPPAAPDLDKDQAPDRPSINGEPDGGKAPMNGGAEQVTPSRGTCQRGPPTFSLNFKFKFNRSLKIFSFFPSNPFRTV